MTRRERMLPATSIGKHSRVFSSIIVKHLICCSLALASNTKSYAHTVLISQALHRSQIRCIAFGSRRAIPQAGMRDPDEFAGTPLRQAALGSERDLLPARLRTLHSWRLISFSVSISQIALSQELLELPTLSFDRAQALPAGGLDPSEMTPPVLDHVLADLVALGDLGDRPFVGFSRIATI